ncbi:Protein lifeguard 2 [Cryptotermes secundus]|uniref:Protein lifeguard 2 n=1 Tax=Cryptotermes secundus TaxID=105785 RepID=A0A2J7QIU3_9NEOP|nr:protein lifeguard 2 [Cryptotermes secundus]XP_023712775.1 protein lifeguard 2 [Cryptotermes secundus]PNF28486.1 Protein lifeguard 2 [Cryptotermes secundus]
MSKPEINSYDKGIMSPPSFEEAMQSESSKQGATYHKQEGWVPAVKPAGDGFPVAPASLAMPATLRDVGAGNVVYVVNQPGGPDVTEDNHIFGASFGNKAIRAVFVRKVYTILMLQLLTTLVFITWFMFHDATRDFVRRNSIILITAYVTFVVTYIILVCCSNVRRSWPCNIIVLTIFTLSMSYWAATISAFHDTYIVIMTVGLVTVVCLGISLFSVQTKWDITGAGIYLFVFLLVVLLFGILAAVIALTTGNRIMTVVYAGLLALVFAMYLVYDTQQIMGGRKVELSAEEHIYGALQLYIDIINLYLIFLSLGSNSCK